MLNKYTALNFVLQGKMSDVQHGEFAGHEDFRVQVKQRRGPAWSFEMTSCIENWCVKGVLHASVGFDCRQVNDGGENLDVTHRKL